MSALKTDLTFLSKKFSCLSTENGIEKGGKGSDGHIFLALLIFTPMGRDMAGAGLEQDPLMPGTLSL